HRRQQRDRQAHPQVAKALNSTETISKLKDMIQDYSKTRETIELAVKSVWPFTGPEVRTRTELMTCSGQVKGLTKPGKEVYGSWPIARVEVDFHSSNAISIEALKLLSRKVERLTGYEFQYFSVERNNPRKWG